MSKKWIFGYFALLFLPFFLLLFMSRSLLLKPAPKEEEKSVCLYRHQSGTLEELPLEEYLWGVVAGEMPASYPEEALKAQAVASYSYLLYRINNMQVHPESDFGHEGDICDNPAHCKAYLSPVEAKAKWGESWYDASFSRIEGAIKAVSEQAVLYEQAPANTVFHAISSGKTEDAADVWGASIPYLQPVDSFWDEQAKGYQSTLAVPLEEFIKKTNATSTYIGTPALTKGGSVATIQIGEQTFTGQQIRTLFGLRSTHFSLKIEKEKAIFTVLGYGHQVGMSQTGAGILAENGYTYDQILSYYYSGTTVKNYPFS